MKQVKGKQARPLHRGLGTNDLTLTEKAEFNHKKEFSHG